MTAPARIVYGKRNTYALDPYVRDEGGRFAVHPAEELPPLQVLIDSGEVVVLANGAVKVGYDREQRSHWTVRTVRQDDGTYRVVYLDGHPDD